MEPLEIVEDNNGHSYITVENVRISLVDEDNADKDFAGTGQYLSFRALTGVGAGINMGPRLPLTDRNVLNLIRAVLELAGRATPNRQATAA